MGTKLNPGRFDCYANALPDEPMFVLLARDPAAPSAIVKWATWRRQAVFADAAPASDLAMIDEGLRCGIAMIGWRQDNLGQWHQPQFGSCTGPAGQGRIVEAYAGGFTVLERNGERFRQHLHAGARLGALGPDPFNPRLAVIAIEGGVVDQPGYETASVLFSMSPDGLEAMAADLLRAAADRRAALAGEGVVA